MSADAILMLTPPDGWDEIPLDPKSRNEHITRMLAPLRQVMANGKALERPLHTMIERAYDDAWRSGVRYAITTRPDPQSLFNIMATFMVALLPPSTPDGMNQLDAIAELLAVEQGSLDDGERLDMASVMLDGFGQAAQAAEIRFVTDAQGNRTDHMIARLRTFIPWEDHVIVTTGITPQVDLADTLFELFARITGTVSVRERVQ